MKIPTYQEVCEKAETEPDLMTPLDHFILDNEPPCDVHNWRRALSDVIDYVQAFKGEE